MTGDNPARKIDLNKEDSRERFRTKAEMPKLAEALDEEAKSGSLYAAKLVWLLLLTGCRRDELRVAKWNQVEFESGVIVLPHTKNRTTHRLPLSEAARAILQDLPREEGNPYIFPSPTKSGALGEGGLQRAWARIVTAAKIQDLRLHDLRRSVGSWLVQSGCTLHLVGKVLDHTSSESTEVHARFNQGDIKEALDRVGNEFLAAAGQKKPADVIEMPTREEARTASGG